MEPGEQLTDSLGFGSAYDLQVYGPNGFLRRFKGGAAASVDVQARYDERDYEIGLTVVNRGANRVSVTLADRYSSRRTKLSLKPGEAKEPSWSLSRTRGWYELAVTVSEDAGFEFRYAGHVENGKPSISDPGMGGLV